MQVRCVRCNVQTFNVLFLLDEGQYPIYPFVPLERLGEHPDSEGNHDEAADTILLLQALSVKGYRNPGRKFFGMVKSFVAQGYDILATLK